MRYLAAGRTQEATMSHRTRMTEARKARKANGLEDTFGDVSVLRNRLSNLQRLLATLDSYQLDPVQHAILKNNIQIFLAETGEELFTSMEPMH
jgi:hypothetical protein